MSNATSSAKPIKAAWGWGRAVLGTVASFYGAQEVASLLVGVYIGARGWNSAQVSDWIQSSPAQFIYTLIVEALALLIIWLFVHHIGWQKVRRAIGLVRPRWRDLAYMAVAFIGYYALYFVILAIFSNVLPIDTEQKQDIGFDGATGFWPLACTFVSLVILPPLVEEIIYRGYLFGGLRRSFSPVIAALLTSVLFAIPHSWQSADGTPLWNAAIDTFALSLVLCYLRERTGSLWAGIGVHLLKNLVAFLAIFIFHVQ